MWRQNTHIIFFVGTKTPILEYLLYHAVCLDETHESRNKIILERFYTNKKPELSNCYMFPLVGYV